MKMLWNPFPPEPHNAPQDGSRAAPFSKLKVSLVLVLAATIGTARATRPAQEGPPKPESVVKTSSYVSSDPVARKSQFEAAVVIEIARNFHVNSHTPRDPYLIATALTVNPPAGVELTSTGYPKGQLVTFPFSPDKPLDVYTGTVKILLHLSASADAPLGPARIPATLRYQACNNSSCLPPVRVPVDLRVEIAPAGTKPRPVHASIFAQP